jgi:RNA polymerase sigma-70 factor, ECF subfamily
MDVDEPTHGQITAILGRIKDGDAQAVSELAPLVALELRRLAAASLRRQPPGHTWQPTDLVNELWVRLLKREELQFENRAHFMGVAAHLMRVMVIDHARARCSLKRMPDSPTSNAGDAFAALLNLTESRSVELVALDGALSRLAEISPRQARIVEMRYFGGFTSEEAAEILGLSVKTVKRDWAAARAWLHARLRGKEI